MEVREGTCICKAPAETCQFGSLVEYPHGNNNIELIVVDVAVYCCRVDLLRFSVRSLKDMVCSVNLFGFMGADDVRWLFFGGFFTWTEYFDGENQTRRSTAAYDA
jgi:hypothetical protein